MLIQVPDTKIKYLKNLCKYFNQMTAYVHEGVHITVDPYAGVEVHEAAESLDKFRDQCIFPDTMDMLNDIQGQLKDTVPDPKDLTIIIERVINEWFFMRQEECGITDGAEPLDSMISILEKDLVKECERVLEWQKQFVKKINDDGTVELNINGRIFVGKFKEE